MAITTQMRTDVSQLYVALFGRAPDGDGLGYWVQQLNAGQSITQIADTMYATAPARAYFPLFATPDEIIARFYVNVLGRTADTEGAIFWTGKLNAPGATPGSVIAEMINVVANYSGTDPAGLASAALFNNKVAVAQWYGEQNGTIADATTILSGVTSDPATVAAATSGSVASGQTFMLTINQDNLTGTTGNDTFVAGAAQDGAGSLINTLQDVDSLDGGAGTDTLKATIADAGTAAVPAAAKIAPTLKNIENVEVRFVGTEGNELSLVGATGVQSITVANSTNADGGVSNVGAVANLAVKNQNVAATFKDNTATTLNLGLDTLGTKAAPVTVTLDNKATTLAVTANNAYVTTAGTVGVKTLSVAATGVNILTLPSVAEALTVTGAGSVELATAFATLKTLDASANTGGVTATVDDKAVTVTGGAGADKITYTAAIAATAKVDLGAGNDTLTLGGTSLKGAVVNGGDGVDTLAVTKGTHLDADSKAIYTGFEVLQVSAASGTEVFDPTLVAGITSYKVAASAGVVELKNLAAAPTVTVIGTAAELTLTLKDATGAADSATVTLDNGAVAKAGTLIDGVAVTKLTATDVETLNIHSNGTVSTETSFVGAANSVTLATLDTTKVVIDGSQALTFTTGAHTAALTIDASAATGKLTLDAALATKTVNINGGTANDVIKAGTAGGLIYGGAGADTITLAAGKFATDSETLVYKAASESVFSVKADGTLDAGKIDSITNFATGTDKIDLTSLNFTANTDKLVLVKGAADLAGLVTLAASADFYKDATNIDRGVVAVTVGTNTYVFADANHDHKFDAATDLVIQLVGAGAVVDGDVVFG